MFLRFCMRLWIVFYFVLCAHSKVCRINCKEKERTVWKNCKGGNVDCIYYHQSFNVSKIEFITLRGRTFPLIDTRISLLYIICFISLGSKLTRYSILIIKIFTVRYSLNCQEQCSQFINKEWNAKTLVYKCNL